MNAKDRKAAAALLNKLETMRNDLDELRSELETMRDAEQEKLENLSDGLRESEKGQAIEAAAEALGRAVDGLDSYNVEEAIDALNEITTT